MIYALIALSVIQTFLLVGAVIFLTDCAQKERRELHDRIMAMAHPDALVTKNAAEDSSPARVIYTDTEDEVSAMRDIQLAAARRGTDGT